MAQKKRPNLLFLMADDMGAWAMHCAGNNEIVTPNLDRLAACGTRLENLFCVSPVCSPARISVYTGQIPSQHGIHDFLVTGHFDAEKALSQELRDAFEMDNPPYEYLWPRQLLRHTHADLYLRGDDTFTEKLAQAGYECGLSGKWHIGDCFTPQAGFTFWHPTGNGGENYMFPVVLEDGQMRLKHNCYVTDYITDNAISFLEHRDPEKPFCLAVHYTAPHSPWAPECHPKEYIDLYRDCPFDSIPTRPIHPWVSGADMSFEEWKKKPHPGVRFIHARYAPIRETWEPYCRESQTGYYAAVTGMDRAIGRILRKLELDGLLEDTLIVFTGDNGSNMGHHGIVGKGNGTYPMNMYDTSVKVPGIFCWPGHIPADTVNESMISHYDFMPTLLALCGVPYEQPERLPGRDVSNLITDPDAGQDGEVVVFDEYGPVRMIRSKRWKLVHRYPDGPDELYDLRKDPGEETNRIDDPDLQLLRMQLQEHLETWFARYVDPALDGSKEDVHGKGQIDSHHFK